MAEPSTREGTAVGVRGGTVRLRLTAEGGAHIEGIYTAEDAREVADALRMAADIVDRLKRDGGVVLAPKQESGVS